MRTLFALFLMASPSLAQVNSSDFEATQGREQPQITIEVRLLTGPSSIFSQLKADELIRTSSHSDELELLDVSNEELLDQGGIHLASARRSVEQHEPVFIKQIDAARVDSLVNAAQQSPAANFIMAPKVTLADGQNGMIDDVVKRPFIVGVMRDGAEHRPQYRVVKDGTSIGLRPRIRGDDVRLDVTVRLSEVTDVFTTEAGDAAGSVQIPAVTMIEIQLAALVEAGHSLAICGFQQMTESSKSANPLLRKIPYSSRMFKPEKVGHREDLLILLTPRILPTGTSAAE